MRTRATGGLGLYSLASQASSAQVIRAYSTSFRLASRMLAGSVRPHIEAIYALVRIADEVVDGAAQEAGVGAKGQLALLDALERETERAMRDGYSTNPVVHAFATTARRCGIDAELTAPFFRSMRRDLSLVRFTDEELTDYVFGSAEVVGLMCLRVFLADARVARGERERLEHGARRLGAAFQKVNFLRDLHDDWGERGRSYLPQVAWGVLSERDKHEVVTGIRADLDAAADAIPLLPASCRRAIRAAHALFSELTTRIDRTPADELLRRRVRVPTVNKLLLLAAAAMGSARTDVSAAATAARSAAETGTRSAA
jgi:phytoene/squalene synthetase